MANTIKRIRYRRVVLTRPFYQPVKIRKVAGVETTGEHQKNAQQSTALKAGQKAGQASQQAVTSVAEPSAQTGDETDYEQSTVASFEPGNNPYAYMVSQLPTILEGIPNLLSPVEPEQEEGRSTVDATVELTAEPEPTTEPESELASATDLEPESTPAAEPELVQGLEPQLTVAPAPEPELVQGLEQQPTVAPAAKS
ncbi:MAG: hypothetical protein HRT35_36445, partial [Algicola sp.]|nr:hypothetical protein [Algicola sp.]